MRHRDFTERADFDIRYTEEADFEHLHAWLLKPKMLDAVLFSVEEVTEFLGFWKMLGKHKACLAATLQGVPVAMGLLGLLSYKKLQHQAMVYLFVNPKYQRGRLGSTLLRNLLHHGQEKFFLKGAFVEMVENPGVREFFEKQGFSCFLSHENYAFVRGEYYARWLLEKWF